MDKETKLIIILIIVLLIILGVMFELYFSYWTPERLKALNDCVNGYGNVTTFHPDTCKELVARNYPR